MDSSTLHWHPRTSPPAAASTDPERRVLIYSHDTFGLGNIRRMLAIAERLVREDPDLHVLLVSGSPMLHSFRIGPRIDFIKLPCLSRDRDGRYVVRSLPLDSQQLLAMRAAIIRSAALAFRPHLVLVDKKPAGLEGELTAALDALARQPRRPAVALVLRDILDAPQATREVWARRGYHDLIARYYDLVLVAGQPEVFDLGREYAFPEATRRKLRYCGYIHRGEVAAPAAPARRRPRILVAAGGGGDGEHMLRAYLQGLAAGLAGRQVKSIVVAGPELAPERRAALQRLAETLPRVRFKTFCRHMEKQVARADLVVCMCGYNSICEVLSMGKRAVAVPRTRPVQEQWLRASRLARRGLLHLVHPEHLDSATLWQAIHAALDGSAAAGHPLDFQGLERITHWVRWLLTNPSGANLASVPIPDRNRHVPSQPQPLYRSAAR